ncbi:hypothetical protein KHQ81_12785 [Mycoplasmatota bacterium]|nr:hypothetical protein KHQ81_12785 [Mycoplasmatota bacterium]
MKYFKKIIFLCIFTISLSIFINEKVTANEIDDDPLNVNMPNGCIGVICEDDGGGGGTSDGNNSYSTAVTISTHFDVKESYSRSDIIDYDYDLDYFKFSTNVDGYMNFHFSSGYNDPIVARIYDENKVELISETATDPNYCESCSFDINDFRIEKNKIYYIRINDGSATDPYNTYDFSMTLVDDLNNENHPVTINSNANISSSIDYNGDVDYYTFTNLGGVYEIYSTGYGTGNIDMKAELYLCNDSNCSSHSTNPIVTNDNHPGTMSFSGMGSNDFGFRVDLGYNNDTYKKTYLLKVYHPTNTQTGRYTIHVDKYIGEVININYVKNDNIGALWENNVILGDPLNSRKGNIYIKGTDLLEGTVPRILKDTFGKDYVNSEYIVRELYIWDKDTLHAMHDALEFYVSKLEDLNDKSDLIVDATVVTGGIIISVAFPPSGLFTSKLILTSATSIMIYFVQQIVTDLLDKGDTINDIYRLLGSLDTAISYPGEATFVFSEVSYMVEVGPMSGVPESIIPHFKLKNGATFHTGTSIDPNRNYFGGKITLISKQNQDMDLLSDILISLAR